MGVNSHRRGPWAMGVDSAGRCACACLTKLAALTEGGLCMCVGYGPKLVIFPPASFAAAL